MNYDDIIEYENEHTWLDFKSIQYEKNTHSAFLKDIIALANADFEGARVIIIGIKHNPNGAREILPIGKDEFVDQAIYQQLVRENIEPELTITYDPYEYKGSLLGIIRVADCHQPPYMMKKDFALLKKGDCYVRKGSHQFRALRADYDRFYESRAKGREFTSNVSIGFSGTNYADEISLLTIGKIELPSARAAGEINQILAEKRKQKELLGNNSLIAAGLLDSLSISPFGNVPYEKRSIETLEKNLENVKKTYREDDLYEAFEVHAHKLNFDILNGANEYIQDATCILEIERHASFVVADHIFEEPEDNHLMAIMKPRIPSVSQYPEIEKNPNFYKIFQVIGDVKHQIPRKMFAEDIRLTIFTVPPDRQIKLRLKLFASNLPAPLVKDLKIIVEEKGADNSNQPDTE